MNNSSSHKRTITSPTTTITTIAIVAVIAAAAAVAIGFTVQQPAYAQLVKDPGASGLTPGEEPKRPGWDPNGAPEDAPGQLAEGPHCIGCANDFAPGQVGLKAGIIGPDIKG
jgi:hypothetical protein